MMWPCPECKILSTSPDGCTKHHPPKDPDETWEDEIIRLLCSPPTSRTDGIVVSGMTFPSTN